MEALKNISGFDKVWQTFFNGCNRYGLGLGQVAAFKRHQADNRTGGRRIAETAFGLFSTPTPRCPFGDNPQAAVEASQSKLPPCPADHRSDHGIAEPLGENLLTAIADPASEPSNGPITTPIESHPIYWTAGYWIFRL